MVTTKHATNSKAPKDLLPQRAQAVKGGLNYTKIQLEYRPQRAD